MNGVPRIDLCVKLKCQSQVTAKCAWVYWRLWWLPFVSFLSHRFLVSVSFWNPWDRRLIGNIQLWDISSPLPSLTNWPKFNCRSLDDHELNRLRLMFTLALERSWLSSSSHHKIIVVPFPSPINFGISDNSKERKILHNRIRIFNSFSLMHSGLLVLIGLGRVSNLHNISTVGEYFSPAYAHRHPDSHQKQDPFLI